MKNFFTFADITVLLYQHGRLPRNETTNPYYSLVADVAEAKENLEDLIDFLDSIQQNPEANQEEIALYEDGVEHFNEQYDRLRTELANKLPLWEHV